jgi:hypothetical protein
MPVLSLGLRLREKLSRMLRPKPHTNALAPSEGINIFSSKPQQV